MSHTAQTSRRARPVADQSGFTLIEALMAIVLFGGVVVALAGLLTSAVSATKVARERTVAEQTAMDQIESIRRLPYESVGVVSGNPPGTVAATRTINERGLQATLTTQISYVADPTPTSYATAANYKRVTVVVRRNGDSKELARQVTYVAPPAQAPYGGINKAIINVGVSDYALNTPVENVAVSLLTGPSAPRNDTTDSLGKVTFAAVDPNPATGPQAFYDLDASLAGYVLFPDPAAQHFWVAPGQTYNTDLQVYKPATIEIVTEDAGGVPYTGPVDVTITSELTSNSETITVTGGYAAVTSLLGDPIVPAVNYTVDGVVASVPLCADAVTQYVPDNYPTDLSTTFTLTLVPCPTGTIQAQVTQGGSPLSGAAVAVSGGPYGVSQNGTTDASGVATFTVPAGDGYTVVATSGSQNAQQVGVSVAESATTTVPLAIAPPTASLTVHVTRNGNNRSGATVVLTGGPSSVNVTHPSLTNSSGNVTFTNVPVGPGYTVTAYRCANSAPDRGTVTNATVSAPSTTINVAFSGGNTC